MDIRRSAFCSPDTVLLFHLTNHYALIYATREWVCNKDSGNLRDHAEKSSQSQSWHEIEVPESTSSKVDLEAATPSRHLPSSTTFISGALCDVCSDNCDTRGTDNSSIPTLTSSPSIESSEKKVIRQILTARRGQRPTAWIDFNEARSIMIGWEGYKIIKCKRKISEDELERSNFALSSMDVLEENLEVFDA